MEVSKLHVPKDCFPRLCFASRNVSRIEASFNRIMKQAGLPETKVYHPREIKTVTIHIYRRPGEKDIFTNEDIVKRDSNKIIKITNGINKGITECLDIVILSSGLEKEDISKLDLPKCFTVFVSPSAKHANEVKEELKSKVSVFSTEESLARDIDDYLESEAYKPLMSYHKTLLDLLSSYQRDDNMKGTETDVQFATPKEIQEEDAEQLLEEIMALYNMSNIPTEKRPKHKSISEPISNEMRKSLFEMCPTIKAVGYRFGKMHLYLQKIENTKETKEREQQIDKFMDRHGVSDYSTSYVFAELDELMTTGSKIVARNEGPIGSKSGTLGCFAVMEAENIKTDCILVSRHVVSDCKNVFLNENSQEKKIGEVIESTTKEEFGSLDIAAAKSVVKIDADARKMKNVDGSPRDGKLDELTEGQATQLNGRRVYIWGSKTKPGKGVIINSCYFVNGMKAGLVEIKNEENDTFANRKPFAEFGDSGAIVCSEDPDDEHVNAHAMLIGSNSETTHLAVPLKEGIEQLEEMTGHKFTLFKGSDD